MNFATAAISLALLANDIGPSDEVIVPDLTFIATANAVRLAGATAVLADIEPVRFDWTDEKLQALSQEQLLNLLENLDHQRLIGRVSEGAAATIDPAEVPRNAEHPRASNQDLFSYTPTSPWSRYTRKHSRVTERATRATRRAARELPARGMYHRTANRSTARPTRLAARSGTSPPRPASPSPPACRSQTGLRVRSA